MNINPCALFGTLLVFTGTIIIAVGSSIPEFVDVFLIRLESEVDSSEPIGGVGVFTSFFDSTILDQDVLDKSGIPLDKFEEPSTEFRLLFPAQKNFVVEILPVNAQLAAALTAATGDDSFEIAINAALTPLNERVFDNCANYVAGTAGDLGNLFGAVLQGNVLPGVVNFINLGFAATFTANAIAAHNALEAADNNNFVRRIMDGAIDAIIANVVAAIPGCENVDRDDTVTVSGACFAAGANGAAAAAAGADQPASAALFQFMGVHFADTSAACAGLTFDQCLNTINFNIVDTALGATVEFGGTGLVDACNIFAACGEAKAQYLQGAAGLAGEQGLVAAAGGDLATAALLQGAAVSLGIYLTAALDPVYSVAGLGVSLAVTTGATVFANPAAGETAFPANFADAYSSCIFPNLFLSVANDLPAAVDCAFSDYFGRAAGVLAAAGQVETAGLVSTVDELYTACAENAPVTGACPGIFTFGIFEGLYDDEVEPAFLVTNATSACEDDNVDQDKIAQAQVALIVSFIFYGLAVICASLGFLLPVSSFAFACAAVSSLLAGVMTLGALLIVQSAPVYEGVGDTPNADFDPENDDINDLDFETFFTNGTAALLAVIAMAIMFVATVAFGIATVMECMVNKNLAEDTDKAYGKEREEVAAKGVAPEEEEEQEVPEAVDVEGGGKVTI